MKKIRRPVTAATEDTLFGIPVTWKMQTVLSVQAGNLKEACQKINRRDYDFPEGGELVPDTFEIDFKRLED